MMALITHDDGASIQTHDLRGAFLKLYRALNQTTSMMAIKKTSPSPHELCELSVTVLVCGLVLLRGRKFKKLDKTWISEREPRDGCQVPPQKPPAENPRRNSPLEAAPLGSTRHPRQPPCSEGGRKGPLGKHC